MRRVRMTIDPHGVSLSRVHELITGGAEYLSEVSIVNWNVATLPEGVLLHVTGDYRRFEGEIDEIDVVTTHEIVPVTDTECYCFIEGEGTPATRALYETFTTGSLMIVPPVRCNEDGSATLTVLGTERDVQATIDTVPEGIDVEVEAIGRQRVAEDGVVGRLSDRQREAIEAALTLGYYDVPRGATNEDVARELGCVTATAAEHLRKAESTLISGLFDE